CTRGRDWADFW
nr:immunoglobulin heavy chain junction region [Mus musculus]